MEADEFIIKIPAHIWARNDSLQDSREKNLDFDVLERTGIHIGLAERKSIYGKTQIQTFTLEEGHREKIVGLLNNPTLYARIFKILDYICMMGQALDNEKRDAAARAISILSRYFPFTDLEDAILSKWAGRASFRSNRSAALVLIQIIKNEQHQKDVVNLLNHWSCQSRIGFANTVLLTYSEIVDVYANNALDAIKNILLNEKTITHSSQEALLLSDDGESEAKLSWRTITVRIFRLTKALYANHPLIFIETLHQWFQERTNFSLTIFSAFAFLSIINVKDIAKDDAKAAKTIAYLYDLWEDKKAPEHQQLQELTTKTVYSWAKTISEMEAKDPDRMACQQFFHELYQKCASAKQNRLDFHLRKWHNQLQQSGKISSSLQTLNFLSLIPDSKQV